MDSGACESRLVPVTTDVGRDSAPETKCAALANLGGTAVEVRPLEDGFFSLEGGGAPVGILRVPPGVR